ncbi:MAG: hypothetical protein A3J62_03130 [Candidatus Buchananbacteria bacterium RIFCSPHIGHO2_02_FULL_38_8]|uniref:Uncharacterized protein n=2 Tax=Candidatus Buchananiibacteriota TaxID=1817903 RepID=A0A1G1XUR9_9BACT|nr:MAG: hypothetical protein A2731_00555 [Candidatus Buchananbacteria bacterium RIFCSPHIGHO2_01_FULL_39_8]OGY47169.1 MAG: hypothetical protein A3J62_03130 [Candidatus Buchananbacteria bacterium RIFCSPHIGHO2_02_FULL_38_8]
MTNQNQFKDKFSASKIGSGRFFTAGKLGGQFVRRGLAGALRAAKTAGRHSYGKNLSGRDLETFQGLLGEELSKLPKHSKGFSYQSRRRIMSKAEQLRKQGKISMADKQDLKNIVGSLGAGSDTVITSKPVVKKLTERAVDFITDQKVNVETGRDITNQNDLDTAAELRRRKNIKAAQLRERDLQFDAEESGEEKVEIDKRSALGQFLKQEKIPDDSNKSDKKPQKIPLVDTDNIQDMEID